MKTSALLIFVLFIASFSFAQSNEEMMKEIEGQWKLDDNGNVTYSRIIEALDLKKDEIFSRAINYFTYAYGSGKSVIQTQDKEAGTIVGKGFYDNVHIGLSLVTTYVDAWHILRVDVKDGRARAIITLTDYDKRIVGGSTPPSNVSMRIAQEYPINPKGGQKTVMTKAFIKAHKKAIASLDAIEKSLKEGTTSKALEAEKW